MNVLVLHCCGQVFEKINSKEEILILAHGFQGYSPCSVCSVVSKPVVRQDAMAEGHGGAQLLTSGQLGSRERQRPGTSYSPRMSLGNFFFQLGPTSESFCHLPIMLSSYESIVG
jgi:hypothetical protein